jgi:hypothetical protein
MTRGELQRLATSADMPQFSKEKLLEKFDNAPFDGFDYHSFIQTCENMVVSYKPKLKNPKNNRSTVGALHQDTAYNLVKFESGIKATFETRIKVDDLEPKNFLNVNDTYATKLLKGNSQNLLDEFKAYCAAEGKKKITLLSKGVDISTYIPVFNTKAELDEFRRNFEVWYVEQGKSQHEPDKRKKQGLIDKENAALAVLQSSAKKAFKWFVGGNNFCADIYQLHPGEKVYKKDAGKWKLDTISNYMAETCDSPLWRKKYPTARRIMQLKINDMVMAEFSKDDESLPQGIKDFVLAKCNRNHANSAKMIFRVKKISSDGRVFLRPDCVAKEEADKKSWSASCSSLVKYKARKIFVSPAGEVKDPGFDNKWSPPDDT